MNAIDYANANQAAFLEQLKEYLRIPSISTLSENKPDIRAAAEFTATQLRQAGMRNLPMSMFVLALCRRDHAYAPAAKSAARPLR